MDSCIGVGCGSASKCLILHNSNFLGHRDPDKKDPKKDMGIGIPHNKRQFEVKIFILKASIIFL